MISRRFFLTLCGLSSTSLLGTSRRVEIEPLAKNILSVIRIVQQHMFPPNNNIPSAKTFRATYFLEETITHHTYDKDIRKFIIEGAEELIKREENFLLYESEEIEKALRLYEKSSSGSNWLNRIMILTLEALLSDPVYGGNYKSLGWRSLDTNGGTPQPSTRYIEL